MTNREEPKTGEVWRHFKGKNYKIICIGHHSETGEKMVVYGWCFDTNKGYTLYRREPCIRPLEMFMSEVDRVKYPDVKQKYRFEKGGRTSGINVHTKQSAYA